MKRKISSPYTKSFIDFSIGNIILWDFDYGDGSPHFVTTTNPIIPSHTYPPLIATYNPMLLVTERTNRCSFIPEQPLRIIDTSFNFAYPPEICLSDTASFRIIGIDTAEILNITWLFGDGDFRSGKTLINPKHKYSNSGVFTVTAVVTDIYGCTKC